ncbi:MAG: AMP-binding protein [Candidatus Thorarchaeota archaeon]|nr:AMP-binding protein [Candidatus Thorarchaeota archaeon]
MEEMLWHTKRWPEHVRWSLDYPDEPLFALLDNIAAKHPDSPSTVYSGLSHSFAEVKDHADRIANFLSSKGIGKGDKVAIFMPNVPMYPPVFFGILKTGATAVTCNPSYRANELNFQLKDSGAKAVFVFDHEVFTATSYEATKGSDVEVHVLCNMKSFLPKAKAILGGLLGKIPKGDSYEEGTVFYDEIIEQFEPKAPDVSINPKEDIALILYTGGTTGTPKGAMLTHLNLYSNVVQIDEWTQLEPEGGGPPEKLTSEEVYVGALPWYHSYGLTLTMVASYYLGSSLICIPDPRAGKPPMSELLSEIQKNKGTILHCVPALYAGIIGNPAIAKYDLSSLKACGSGAAPLPPELAKNFESVTGATLFEGYGLTETSPLATANPSLKSLRKFGSIGVPISDTYVTILDMDTGKKVLKQGETGEIAISGPQVMAGYWNKPEETAEVMRDIKGKRYFLTGDIGHMDEEGFFVISDRKKDMINVGGLKAYPREIEDIFFEHPKVAMAAVIGLPRADEPTNEFVRAYLVLKEGETGTEDEFIAWAKDKMVGYKRPKEIVFVGSLPLTAIGKVLRRVLKEAELANE